MYPSLLLRFYPVAILLEEGFFLQVLYRVHYRSRVWYFALPAWLRDVNKPATRNTRRANDNVHAKGLARKKRSASRVSSCWHQTPIIAA